MIADHGRFMGLALREARRAMDADEVPVGAVVVVAGRVVARSGNAVERRQDPTAHAEARALARAGRGRKWLQDATLYVTLEPCPMCAGIVVLRRVGHVVFGAADPKAGAFGSVIDLPLSGRLNHVPRVTPGIRADESAELLGRFFRELRSRRPRREG